MGEKFCPAPALPPDSEVRGRALAATPRPPILGEKLCLVPADLSAMAVQGARNPVPPGSGVRGRVICVAEPKLARMLGSGAVIVTALFVLAACGPTGRLAAAPASGQTRVRRGPAAPRHGAPRQQAGARHQVAKPGAARGPAAPGHAGAANGLNNAATHPLELVGKVNGRGWYLPWYTRDPKNPNGPPIHVLSAEAVSGEITNREGKPVVVLHRVNAKLYQKGVHAANVRAGKVRASQIDNMVFGTGGCRVVSLLNPADTVLTADRITWDTRNTLFIAEGHAHVERTPRNGGLPIVQEGGKIVYDLEHNTISVL